MINIFLYLFYFFGIFLNQNSVPDFYQKADFKVYNAILFKNTPDLTQYGFSKFNMYYEADLLKDSPGSKSRNERIVNYGTFRKNSLASKLNSSTPTCLNIESWRLTPSTIRKSKPKYLNAIKLFRSYNSTSKVGYYGLTRFQWMNELSDILYPSFYTYNKNLDSWKENALTEILRLRKLNPGKSIYAFICPQYTPNKKSSKFAFQFVDPDVWAAELEFLYKYADGIVIWSHYKDENGKPIYFNIRMPWFIKTSEFIKNHKINSK